MNFDDSFTITDEMIDMGLRGNDLLVYAIIARYSQAGFGLFNGDISYIANLLKISEKEAAAILERLVKKGLVKKYDSLAGGSPCSYAITNP